MEIPIVTQHDNDDEDRIVEIADNGGNIAINNNNNVEDMIPGILINVTMVTQQYTCDLEDEDEEDEDVKEMEEEKEDVVVDDENGKVDENGKDDDNDEGSANVPLVPPSALRQHRLSRLHRGIFFVAVRIRGFLAFNDRGHHLGKEVVEFVGSSVE